MPTYTASRISSPDNRLFPDKLEIDPMKVAYYKGTVVGYQSTVIARQNIASVSVSAGIFFADIIIEIYGGHRIAARGFTKSKAREIVNFLTAENIDSCGRDSFDKRKWDNQKYSKE